MKFVDYLAEQIELIAQGSPHVDTDFEDRFKVYLQLVSNGNKPETSARIIDTLYM